MVYVLESGSDWGEPLSSGELRVMSTDLLLGPSPTAISSHIVLIKELDAKPASTSCPPSPTVYPRSTLAVVADHPQFSPKGPHATNAFRKVKAPTTLLPQPAATHEYEKCKSASRNSINERTTHAGGIDIKRLNSSNIAGGGGRRWR